MLMANANGGASKVAASGGRVGVIVDVYGGMSTKVDGSGR